MDAEELLDSLADIIADKVAERLVGSGVTSEGPPAQTVPATTEDEPTGAAPKTRRRRASPKKAEPEPEPQAEEDDPEDTVDLVTEDQRAFVQETADDADLAEIRADLLEYHVGLGNDQEEISATLADMDEPEIRAAYADYLARLVVDDGKEEMDFTDSFETPYKAHRVNDGVTSLKWIVGGATLTDDDVKARKLGDPAKKTRTRRAPSKKK